MDCKCHRFDTNKKDFAKTGFEPKIDGDLSVITLTYQRLGMPRQFCRNRMLKID